MAQGLVKVSETGDIEKLAVRNLGGREVFIQSGDIVKGGQQDRVLVVSMILPPDSEDIPIGAFCVEQGRWARRGQEKTTEFSSFTARLPSQAGRRVLAERARREIVSGTDSTARQITGQQPTEAYRLQRQVWDSVREVQAYLSDAVGLDVADERSPSSLQLSLENTALASALKDYEASLGRLPQEHPDAVGYVFAINGKINSAGRHEPGNARNRTGTVHRSATTERPLGPPQLRRLPVKQRPSSIVMEDGGFVLTSTHHNRR